MLTPSDPKPYVTKLSCAQAHRVLCLCFAWCPYMAINVSVQYNGGFLPDTILLTLCYYDRGTRLNAMKRVCICSLCSHPNVLTFSHPVRGMLRRFRCVQAYFLKPYRQPGAGSYVRTIWPGGRQYAGNAATQLCITAVCTYQLMTDDMCTNSKNAARRGQKHLPTVYMYY